ncbi:Hint domain-containing protein [Pseudophaeobacter sp.]|uniref:Hint domain-containing protein n=1 Tax=Pseudophaeobacter sp. TaxID=1971739 RepID=UPI003298C46D
MAAPLIPSPRRRTFQSVDDQASFVALLPGTLLHTRRGDCRVETLRPGDDIISRDQGLVTCTAIQQRTCSTNTIWFAPGSLGDSRPECDVILPADQQILLRDWRAKAIYGKPQALARAATLVDEEFICDLGPREITLTVLHFGRPHIIYAGGLEVAAARHSAGAQSGKITALG